MKLTQKQLILIVGIGTLIITGGLVGVAWRYKENKNNAAVDANVITQENLNSATNNPGNTDDYIYEVYAEDQSEFLPITDSSGNSGWKHLMNESGGYSIDFPRGYAASFGDTQMKSVVLRGENLNTIKIGAYPTTSTELPNEDDFQATVLEPTEAASLAGVAGKKYVLRMCDGPGCTSDYVSIYAINNSVQYGVSFYGDRELDATEEKILESFAFLSPSDPSYRKIYINEAFNYLVRYPQTWTVRENESVGNYVKIMPPDWEEKTSLETGPGIIIYGYDNIIQNDLVSNSHQKEINGLIATQQDEGGLVTSRVTYFPYPYQDTYVRVSWDTAYVSDYPELESILSSFRFKTRY
ncbi:MAG: hypothetical protein WC495_04570 [Patescibacteria group bacterium]|jgi:hypothetical protein